MLKAYPLPEWKPDLPDGLSLATNVYATAKGYAPVKGFQAITSALPNSFYGGAAFISSTGVASLLVGTPDYLFIYSGAFSPVYAVTASSPWRFAQFGDNVLCANGGKLVSYDLVNQTASEVSSSPPDCVDVARVRDFVKVIRSDDTAEWSEFNDSNDWGTGENQADFQPLLGTGKGVAIVGGENALILEQYCVQRATYVGGDIVFQYDVIANEIGCMTRGSVAWVNQMVFWLSERGFVMSPDRQTIVPIADEKFNRWFFETYSRSQIDEMYAAVDPRRSLVMWAMPGNPGRIIAYNWVLQRATVIQTAVSGVFTGFTSNISVDALDALYPDGLDSIPVSLDDPSFSGGNPLLLLANADNEIGALEGDNLQASLKLDNVEPTPGRRSRIRSLRPIGDMVNASATVNARMRKGDSEGVVTASSMRDSGKMPIRANGRFNDVTLTIPAGEAWSEVQGVEVEFEAGDAR